MTHTTNGTWRAGAILAVGTAGLVTALAAYVASTSGVAIAQYKLSAAGPDGGSGQCPPLPERPSPSARPLFDELELVAWWTPDPAGPQIVPLPGVPTDLVPTGVSTPPDPALIDPDRSLLVIDPATLGSQPLGTCEATGPGAQLGKWTLGCLLVRMAGAQGDAERLARTWMDGWRTSGTVNNWPLPGDEAIDDLVKRWDRANDGRLRPGDAPFRLMAIVNRVDRHDPDSPGHAGDARFVFAAAEADGTPRPDLSVIVEFEVRRGDMQGVRDWAGRWKALDGLALGSDDYRAALAQIADDFTRSPMVRVRTLKVLGGVRDWEMREFEPSGDAMLRRPVTDTPRGEFNAPPLIDRLRAWIEANRTAVIGLEPNVPPDLEGIPFRGGAAAIQYRMFWAPAVEPRLRHRFALSTCNGCHYLETAPEGAVQQTTEPQHLRARAAGQAADRSCFLVGGAVVDPDGSRHYFADLLRRQAIMAGLSTPPPPPAAPSPGRPRRPPRVAH